MRGLTRPAPVFAGAVASVARPAFGSLLPERSRSRLRPVRFGGGRVLTAVSTAVPPVATWEDAQDVATIGASDRVCFNNAHWMASAPDDDGHAIVYLSGGAIHFLFGRRTERGIEWEELDDGSGIPVPSSETGSVDYDVPAIAFASQSEDRTWEAYGVGYFTYEFVVAAPRTRSGRAAVVEVSLIRYRVTVEDAEGSSTVYSVSIAQEDLGAGTVGADFAEASVAVTADEVVFVTFGGEPSAGGLGVWLWDSDSGSVVELETTASTGNQSSPRLPSVAVDRTRVLVAWRRQDDASSTADGQDVVTWVARHDGTGAATTLVAGRSVDGYAATDPSVAGAPGGGFVLGFTQLNDGGYNAAHATLSFNGEDWDTAEELEGTLGVSTGRFVATAATDDWTGAVWEAFDTPSERLAGVAFGGVDSRGGITTPDASTTAFAEEETSPSSAQDDSYPTVTLGDTWARVAWIRSSTLQVRRARLEEG